jgi:hypothetical protein
VEEKTINGGKISPEKDWKKNAKRHSTFHSHSFRRPPPPLRLEEEEEEEKEDLRMEGFARRRGYRVTRSRSMVSGGGGVFLFLFLLRDSLFLPNFSFGFGCVL